MKVKTENDIMIEAMKIVGDAEVRIQNETTRRQFGRGILERLRNFRDSMGESPNLYILSPWISMVGLPPEPKPKEV